MKNHFCVLILLLNLAVSPLSAAETGKRCSPSEVTDDQARILLYVIPVAVYARRRGTDIDIERLAATKEFPRKDYFVAEIVARKPIGALGNGVLGYYSVNKHNASVEFLGNQTLVKGNELARVQNWIRHEHCIKTPALPK